MKNILKTVLLFAVTVGYSQTTTKNYIKKPQEPLRLQAVFFLWVTNTL